MMASFSSKRDARGLSARDGAAASEDLRDRIWSPGLATGMAKDKARSSSPGRNWLQISDQELVGHDRGGAEHLGAAHRDAGAVLIDQPGDEILLLLAPGLGAVGLRVDDHIAQIQVV